METPLYLQKLKPKFPDLSEPELELRLSVSAALQKVTGVSAHEHRKRGMMKLFPARAWHSWRDERMRSVQQCLEGGIQELMWMGSASSGKSADMADGILSLWWSNPKFTTVYVTSPYKEATERGIWAAIVEQFWAAKAANPSLPGEMRVSQNAIVLNERDHPRAFIRLVTADEVGKIKGKKAIDPNTGLIILVADELPEFADLAGQNLLKSLENLTSNRNLLFLGAGNFTSIGDSFARLTSPDERDIPGGWFGFNPDQHLRWRSDRGGLVLRFDGTKSPNMLAGRDIYPYLTRIGFVARHAAAPGGLKSPDAMREVRSAPVTSLDEYTVTNLERIKAGKAREPYEWTSDTVQTGAFCDTGWSGDACVVQKFKLGWIRENGERKQILALWDSPHEIPIEVGSQETMYRQVALGLKRYCDSYMLDPKTVSYDAAMRPGLAQAIALHYSIFAVAIDSEGPASNRKLSTVDGEKTWKDEVDRLVSEFWFAVASLIDSQQLRGLELSPKAIEQFCTRRWERRGKKKAIQTKKEYRALLRSMGRLSESPNEADCVAGCAEMARRMGLGLEGTTPGGGAVQTILEMISKGQSFDYQTWRPGREELPTGGLYANKPPRQSHGRLSIHR